MNNKQKEEYHSFNLILFAWKWRKLLLIVSVATAILAFVFSSPWIIKPKFKSTAIIYAPRTNSLSQILMNQNNYNERLDIKAYGTEGETEQMMQILNSLEVKDAMIEKFNLIEHYDIDTNKKAWQTKLYKTFDANCMIKRTQYGAIAVNVLDVEPQLAADLANAIIDELDTIKNSVERKRAEAAYLLLKEQLKDIEEEVARLDDSLKIIMENGVYDFESQSERVMQQYAIAVAQGNNAAQQRLQNELAKLAKHGQKAVTFRENLLLFREYKVLCQSKMMDAKIDMDSHVPVKFTIQQAIPSDKKDYPKKLIIVLISTLSVFILTLLTLLIINNIQENITSTDNESDETTN